MQAREQELERAASEALAASSAAEAEHSAEEERLCKLRQELEDLGKKVLILLLFLRQRFHHAAFSIHREVHDTGYHAALIMRSLSEQLQASMALVRKGQGW